MNITDAFFNNGQLNWDAISTIFNIILVGALVIVTLWYAKQVKKQTEFMKIDRLVKEMDKFVAPLYSKMGDKILFQRGVPGYIDSTRPRDQGYFRFWDEIKQTKYLGPDYLRSAIDNYLRASGSMSKHPLIANLVINPACFPYNFCYNHLKYI